ncbi:chorismate synthase [Peptacetobacter sp.]|uniref:chorismate synthase n=1 Tax=Peptacetobacter sp. TaxID=2991975 RepID=UPI002627EF6A|nr:chorismate synthase [Peptacetobacter sp.]
MSSMWGKNIKISIFGESHGKEIGVVIDGIESGFEIDFDKIKKQMDRRKPGQNKLSTSRKEEDIPEIVSGFFEGKTTGTPLCAVIKNKDKKSVDYTQIKNNFRPGHADYTGFIKYKGYNDYRGGGHFSGRLTAPIVFAGAICRQILEKNGIKIVSHIKSIKDIDDDKFDYVNISDNTIQELSEMNFPVINKCVESKMKKEILDARENLDSVGGKIECAVVGIDAGFGSPIFDTIESTISSMMFSIPAVKGIEFGSGFNVSSMYGSESNDELFIDDEYNIKSKTNNNGGVIGGITNGMPIVFTVAIKPTPSIAKKQNTINISKIRELEDNINIVSNRENIKNTEIEIKGRHDPCIVQRAVSVVENAVAIAILDIIYDK